MPDYYLLNDSLIVATLLLALGVVGLVSRRNLVVVLLSTCTMLQGATMAVAGFGSVNSGHAGETAALFALALSVLQPILIAAFVLLFARRENSLDVSLWSRLRADDSAPEDANTERPPDGRPFAPRDGADRLATGEGVAQDAALAAVRVHTEQHLSERDDA